MRFSKSTPFCIVALVVILLIPASAIAGTAENRAKCEAWLNDHYRSHSRLLVVWEYTQDSMYNFRANYEVLPSFGGPAIIGYDCTIKLRTGKMISFPSVEPYEKQAEVEASVGSLEKHRVKYGKNACPSLSAFKALADALNKGNYRYDLPPSCSWLDRGQVVLGPIKTVEYGGYSFALIALPNGEKRWIDAADIFDE